MEYVMVPVPEEHVVDVMQHVARLVARASVVPWEEGELGRTFDEVDEACRSLLSIVARHVVAGKEISDDDVAKTLELTVREVRAIVRELNEVAIQAKHEPIVTLRETSVVLRNGRTVQRRTFAMTESSARTLRSHERTAIGGADAAPADSTE